MFRNLFIQASKKGWNFFFLKRSQANDYLTKAIQIRELFWDYSKGLVIIIVPAGFSTEGCHRTDAYRVSNINMSRKSLSRIPSFYVSKNWLFYFILGLRKGACTNRMDRILGNFDLPPSPFCKHFYLIAVIECCGHLSNLPLPQSSSWFVHVPLWKGNRVFVSIDMKMSA